MFGVYSMVWQRSEIINFIKDNFVKLLLGIAVFTLLYVNFMGNLFPRTDLNTKDLIERVNNIKTIKRAYFHIYIQDKNGEEFFDSVLLAEILNSTDVLERANETLIRSNNKRTGLSKKEESQIEVSLDEQSNLFELAINFGDESSNMALAHFYYELLKDHNITALVDNEVFIFSEPHFKEDEMELDNLVVQIEENKKEEFMTNLTIGLGLSVPVMFLLVLLLSKFSRRLNSSLTYQLELEDDFLLISKEEDRADLVNGIMHSVKMHNSVVLSERKIAVQQYDGTNKIKICSSVNEIDELNKINRLIYIIEKGITTREWYNKQRLLGNKLNKNSLVIQLNSD